MGKAVSVEQLLADSRRLRDELRRMADHAVELAEDLIENAQTMREEAGVVQLGIDKGEPDGDRRPDA